MKTEQEQLAEQIHNWYLESCKELHPESYNPKAQKSYAELTEEQKDLDRYQARKILENYISKKVVEETLKNEDWAKLLSELKNLLK